MTFITLINEDGSNMLINLRWLACVAEVEGKTYIVSGTPYSQPVAISHTVEEVNDIILKAMT